MQCPPSAGEEARLPARESKWARAGSELHEHIALGTDPDDEWGRISCAGCRRKMVQINPVGWQHETRWEIHRPSGELITWTYTDAHLIMDDEAHIYEWKFGWKLPSDSALALQLGGQAVALLQSTPAVQHVFCVAYCPRSEATFEATVTRADCEAILDSVERAIQASATATEYHVGEWCDYCRAKPVCPAFSRETTLIAHEALPIVDVTRAARIVELCSALDAVVTEAKNVVKDALRCGLEVRNTAGRKWYLREVPGKRSIEDVQRVYELVQDLIPLDRFLALIELPLGVLEECWMELYSEKHHVSKKNAKTVLSALLESSGAVVRGDVQTWLCQEKG